MVFDKRFFGGLAIAALVARMVFMAEMPLTDPSEARYGVMAANMARTGDFMEPHFIHNGKYQSFDGKPPLFFQAGGVVCKLFGQSEFAVRLPSLLAALLAVGMVFYTVSRLRNKKAALCAAVMCGTNCLFYVFAGLCMTDMLLAFCITGALCAYMLFAGTAARGDSRPPDNKMCRIYSAAFFAFLGLGMLAKGPVAIVLSGLPVFVYVCAGKRWKELRRHAWVAGPLVFLALTLPWYARMAVRDPGFLEYFFINENILRFITPEYGDRYGSGHDTFKGMALIWFLVASLPWLPLALGAGMVCRGKRMVAWADFKGRPEIALPLLGCLCMTAFWCLTARALLPYLLPAPPLVAMWAAAKLDDWGALDKAWMSRALKILAPFACAVVWIGLCVATWLGHNLSGKMPRGIYREMLRAQRENPAYADAKYVFISDENYSAEFYLGDTFRNHSETSLEQRPEFTLDKGRHARLMEAVERDPGAFRARAREIEEGRNRAALERSRNDFLLVTRKQMVYFTEPPQREVVCSNRYWTVFAPEARGTE